MPLSAVLSQDDRHAAILALADSAWVADTLSALVLQSLQALAGHGFTSPAKVPRTMASTSPGQGAAMAWMPLEAGDDVAEMTLRASLELAVEPDALGVARFELEVLRPLMSGVGQQARDRRLGASWMFATPVASFEQTTPQGLEEALRAHLDSHFTERARPQLGSSLACFAAEVDALLSQ